MLYNKFIKNLQIYAKMSHKRYISVTNDDDPTQSTVVFEYDKSRPVTDEYIIIPIARVDAKYSMYPTEGWYIRSYDNYITYGDVATDTFVIGAQLEERDKKIAELENRIKALEKFHIS